MSGTIPNSTNCVHPTLWIHPRTKTPCCRILALLNRFAHQFRTPGPIGPQRSPAASMPMRSPTTSIPSQAASSPLPMVLFDDRFMELPSNLDALARESDMLHGEKKEKHKKHHKQVQLPSSVAAVLTSDLFIPVRSLKPQSSDPTVSNLAWLVATAVAEALAQSKSDSSLALPTKPPKKRHRTGHYHSSALLVSVLPVLAFSLHFDVKQWSIQLSDSTELDKQTADSSSDSSEESTASEVEFEASDSICTIASPDSEIESLYKVHDDKATYLNKHPPQNSVVVAASQVQSRTKQTPVPPSKEGWKLDAMGRNLYTCASLLHKISNYQGAMGTYQRELLAHLHPFLKLIPEAKRGEASALYEEAMALAAQQMRTSKHSFDCSSKVLNASVTLRCHAWLRTTGLLDDHKAQIETLPFEGTGLYNASTDDLMEDRHRKQDTAKKLNVIPQQPKQPFRFQPRHHYWPSSFQSTSRQVQHDRSTHPSNFQAYSSRTKKSKSASASTTKTRDRRQRNEY
ncbi:hypothetical protein JRQ81_003352 [Phrynocephalus forsythii]|uniref:Uncharacterized protein n=1 Tax=Phrynocephalus forsythii TaxID=171643 RepID=A0A9Q1AXD2_9SAUR|nr:hypothetical protein JRQ81_003352 [Phrynocephalus forsythii]